MSMTIEQRISVDIDNHFWRGYPMPDYLTDAEKDIVGGGLRRTRAGGSQRR